VPAASVLFTANLDTRFCGTFLQTGNNKYNCVNETPVFVLLVCDIHNIGCVVAFRLNVQLLPRILLTFNNMSAIKIW
jgi:hypothetical protein